MICFQIPTTFLNKWNCIFQLFSVGNVRDVTQIEIYTDGPLVNWSQSSCYCNSFIHSFIYLHVKNPLHVPRTGYRQLSSIKYEHIKYNAC
jgi:hypothetical protein